MYSKLIKLHINKKYKQLIYNNLKFLNEKYIKLQKKCNFALEKYKCYDFILLP